MSSKAGEKVTIHIEQENANGELLSDMEVNWYGMDNQEANNINLSIVQAVKDLAVVWSRDKNAGSTAGKR